MTFNQRVWNLCKRVPKGKVTTYREIGRAMRSKAYRAIGQALRRNPHAPKVPCHRVVASDGTIGGFKGCASGKTINEKIKLLKKEGVIIEGKKIKKFSAKLHQF